MVPIWVTVLIGLGAGVTGTILTSIAQFWITRQVHKQQLEREKIAFEREQIKEEAAYGRKEREQKKERIRQAGKMMLQATQSILDIITDAMQIFEYYDLVHQRVLIKLLKEGTSVEGMGPGPDNSPEYKRLGAELRRELSRFDDGVETLRLEVPSSQIFVDNPHMGLISSFRYEARDAIQRIEQYFVSGPKSEEDAEDMLISQRRILTNLRDFQKMVPKLLAEPDKVIVQQIEERLKQDVTRPDP